jgi:ectoine hydroxylase-related dioxygenase (phytanoyl-CoA dioxygenase family)
MNWKPTDEQLQEWNDRGFFIAKDVVSRQMATEMLGVIKNAILMPEMDDIGTEPDPMDPMNDDTPEARAVRFRKLNMFCRRNPLIWHYAHGGEAVNSIAKYFLGDDIVLKYDTCFLKPARSGSATPWHQDNGLWRDGDIEPFNWWMALDPATKENGCLQFIPSSHKTEIVHHVLYEDSLHGELPHERVEEMIDTYGVVHVELEPGSIVCWHSNAWHYSPPNSSEYGRIAIAGVYSTPEIVQKRVRRDHDYRWIMKNGQVPSDFPSKPYKVPNPDKNWKPKPWTKVGEK